MFLFAEILCCLVVLRAKNITIEQSIVSLTPIQINVRFLHRHTEGYWYLSLENFYGIYGDTMGTSQQAI